MSVSGNEKLNTNSLLYNLDRHCLQDYQDWVLVLL